MLCADNEGENELVDRAGLINRTAPGAGVQDMQGSSDI